MVLSATTILQPQDLNPKHTIYTFSNLYNWCLNEKRTNIIEKRPGLGHIFLKKKSLEIFSFLAAANLAAMKGDIFHVKKLYRTRNYFIWASPIREDLSPGNRIFLFKIWNLKNVSDESFWRGKDYFMSPCDANAVKLLLDIDALFEVLSESVWPDLAIYGTLGNF